VFAKNLPFLLTQISTFEAAITKSDDLVTLVVLLQKLIFHIFVYVTF